MSHLESLGPRAFGNKSNDVEKRLGDVQALLGGALPPSLQKLLKAFDGASVIFDNGVRYTPVVASPWARADGTQSLEILFGLSDAKTGLEAQFNRYGGRMPNGIVPIGEGPGGNLIVLALRDPTKGKVFLWDHEGERPITGNESNDFGNMFIAAESLDDFLAALTPEESAPLRGDISIEGWLVDDL